MPTFIKETLQTEGFLWQSALNLALASGLAYREPDDAREVATTQWGYEGFDEFDADTTQGFITWDDEVVLVSFRGTQQLGDWLTNLGIFRTRRPYGALHNGFFRGYEVVAPRINDILHSASPTGKKVWITGHSLGGALATVMGAELRDDLAITGFYTFGQPKCGNRDVRSLYRDRYPEAYFRFVNDDDIVPKIPPNFRHVGNLFWFDEEGSLKERPPGMTLLADGEDDFGPHELTEAEFAAMQQQFIGFEAAINREHQSSLGGDTGEIPAPGFEVQGIFPSVRDHMIDRYIERIQARLPA